MEKAAEQDHPRALEFLAVMHRDGIAVSKDPEKALELFRRSAQVGNPSAQAVLAEMYFKGEGGEKDFVQAYLFAGLAAAQEFPGADKLQKKAAKKLSAEERQQADAALASLQQVGDG
jgi:TPR repeat protein